MPIGSVIADPTNRTPLTHDAKVFCIAIVKLTELEAAVEMVISSTPTPIPSLAKAFHDRIGVLAKAQLGMYSGAEIPIVKVPLAFETELSRKFCSCALFVPLPDGSVIQVVSKLQTNNPPLSKEVPVQGVPL